MRELIAIVDRLAGDIVGPIQLFPHDAPAIRMFSDVCLDNRTAIAQHVEDHELVSLGQIDDSQIVTPNRRVIITGAQWKAAQNANTETHD